jgi:hypothetical protein
LRSTSQRPCAKPWNRHAQSASEQSGFKRWGRQSLDAAAAADFVAAGGGSRWMLGDDALLAEFTSISANQMTWSALNIHAGIQKKGRSATVISPKANGCKGRLGRIVHYFKHCFEGSGHDAERSSSDSMRSQSRTWRTASSTTIEC